MKDKLKWSQARRKVQDFAFGYPDKLYGMKYKTLKLIIQKRVGWITINRPKKLNALNQETLAELHHALAILKKTIMSA